jgi:hypothetical protein
MYCIFGNAMIQYKCFDKLTLSYQNTAHRSKGIRKILAVLGNFLSALGDGRKHKENAGS